MEFYVLAAVLTVIGCLMLRWLGSRYTDERSVSSGPESLNFGDGATITSESHASHSSSHCGSGHGASGHECIDAGHGGFDGGHH